MPTLGTMRLLPPRDGIEFQDITLAALRQRWNSPDLERHGRPGQAQKGVDLYGPDNMGRKVGVQCKCVERLTKSEIELEISQAEEFEPPLQALHIATSLPTDAKLQKEVRIISEERLKAGKFPVGIIFWEAIRDEIIQDRAILQHFYPDLAPATKADNPEGSRLLSALDIGYLGTNLKYRMGLLFGDSGILSGEDPHSFSRVTLQLETCGQVLFKEPARTEFVQLNHDLLAGALRLALGQAGPDEDWDKVEPLATRIAARVEGLENMLLGEELAAFTCGRLLGLWDQLESDDKLPTDLVEHLIRAITSLKLTDLVERVRIKAKEFEENKSLRVVHIASLLHKDIRMALRTREFQK